MSYTLTFETNNGTSIDPVTFDENTEVDLNEYVTHRQGYDFVSWCNDSDLTEETTSITMTGDKTIYAKWQVNNQIKEMRLIILGDANNAEKDNLFEYYLKVAFNTYVIKVYPFKFDEIVELPKMALDWQTRCAIQLYDNYVNGLDNAIMYSENGLQIQFAKGGLSKDLLAELPPTHASVPLEDENSK